MMSAMGANIEVHGLNVTVARSELDPVDISVPGDISGAAFWLVAGAVHPNAEIRLSGVGINATRSGVLEVLNRMGASISVEERQGRERRAGRGHSDPVERPGGGRDRRRSRAPGSRRAARAGRCGVPRGRHNRNRGCRRASSQGVGPHLRHGGWAREAGCGHRRATRTE